MCLHACGVVSPGAQNWEGEEILHDSTSEAARYVPGTRKRFPIDIREYLTWSRKVGAFDHPVRVICEFLSRKVAYRRKERGFKQWLFPGETLASAGGDCEDRAFLLASLLLASGVSGYVIRVALGKFRNVQTGQAADHAWVMCKSEAGSWLLLDPLIFTKDSREARGFRIRRRAEAPEELPGPYEYVPCFVFNDVHLWAVRNPEDQRSFQDYCSGRSFRDHFDPSFAAGVHDHIFDEALAGVPWVKRQYVKAVNLAVDTSLPSYNPLDHFDNGDINEGWARVRQRLATGNPNDFALAAHAIGDFHAHSSWGVFGNLDGGIVPSAGPGPPGLRTPAELWRWRTVAH